MLRHLRVLTLCAGVVGVAFSGSSVLGDSQPPQAPGAIADEFAGLHFRSIGPASMSGRIADLAVYESNPAVYYVGTAHGGVWKTTSNGAQFEPLFQDMGHMSIGDVTISQRDPNLVWVGTGESNNRQSTSWGDGVYKSTDGGRTWTHMGLRESRHINRIVIDPDDNNIVFVAATGPLFGSGGERGVYKSIDGGKTWKAVLRVDDNTGANDLVMASTDRRTIYASMYARQRSQCCFNGGSTTAGIFKSTDHGETWTKLTNTLPTGEMGRIALDVYRHSANLVYALIEAEAPGGGGRGAEAAGGRGAEPAGGRGAGGRGGGEAPQGGRGGGQAGGLGSGLYRSDDGGATWRRVNATNPRPMYFSQVRIDPNNPDRVYMGGVGLHMTNDGGQSMATDAAFVTHDDVHAIWINPNNTEHVLIGHDGGVSVSYDASRTWVQLPNLPLALYYHVAVDFDTPYNICGGLQDNYNWCGPSAVRFSRGIKNSDWYQVQGGDGFVVLVDQRDPRYVYSESQNGNIQRKNKITGESRNIRPNNSNVGNLGDSSPAFRWNWDTPMVFSAHDPSLLIVAANRVFTSRDRGDSWAVISPDLTSNADRDEMEIMGKRGNQPMLSRHDGITSWPTIVSLSESPKQAGVIVTGTDDGVVAMTKDGGKTWDRITERLTGFPKGAWVSEVVPSRFNAGTVYVAADAHRLNDYKTYMWASDDFGATFRSINGNLSDQVVRTLLEDTKNPDVLYAGTETGIFLSLDRGKSWRRLRGRNFPTVRVDEMVIHPRDNALVVGTHGRALWVLDHLEPIQEYAAAQAASADARLFSIPNALQWRFKDDQNDEFWGHQVFVGENPPADAVIQFQLKKTVGSLALRIADASGRQLRELEVPANRNQAGIQTVCWDMRIEPLPEIEQGPQPGGGRQGGGQGRGGGQAARGGGGGGRGPGGGLTGIPMPQTESGYDPFNPCGGGGGGGGRGGGGGGGGAAGPLVLPGTYNVSLVVDGKVVDTKPIRVVADPANELTDVQRRRYYDITTELHDLQRRGTEVANALTPLHAQITEAAGKVGGLSDAAVKAQFDALQKDFAAVGGKFGVPPPQAGGGGGRGGGGRGGGQALDPANVLGQTGAVKSQILAFYDTPSEALMRAYTDVRTALPKAVVEANAFITRAMTVSQALKKHNIELTVPAPVKVP